MKNIYSNGIINIGENMNKFDLNYKDNLYNINIYSKKNILDNEINIFSITKNYSFNLGNFYTDSNVTKDLVIKLLNNIDKVIFKDNRCILKNKSIKKEIIKSNKKEEVLAQIYSEFLKFKKNSIKYIKYSRFQELYYYGHDIPDTIRYLYLNHHNKKILDYSNLDEKIKKSFAYTAIDLKSEDDYKYNLKLRDELNIELDSINKELSMLNDIILYIKEYEDKLNNNINLNISVENLESKLKSISFFDKNRKRVKNKLRDLKNNIVKIDILDIRSNIYNMYKEYALEYDDRFGILVIFDNLEIMDILSILQKNYVLKEKSCSKIKDKINLVQKELDSYNIESIDISDLYERLDV